MENESKRNYLFRLFRSRSNFVTSFLLAISDFPHTFMPDISIREVDVYYIWNYCYEQLFSVKYNKSRYICYKRLLKESTIINKNLGKDFYDKKD